MGVRSIIFRGKSTDDDEWVYGSFVMDAMEQMKGKNDGEDGFIRYYDKEKHKMVTEEVQRETVCQYTGLTDKNGKKIFDGDIVKRYEDYGVVKFGEYEIRSVENRCLLDKAIGWYIKIIRQFDRNQLFPRSELSFCRDFEVIGNIFDNSELIGDQQ